MYGAWTHTTGNLLKSASFMRSVFPGGASGKELSCRCRRCERHGFVPSLGSEDSLEQEMAIHSSILAWRIPQTEKPQGLCSIRSQRVRHD